MRRALARAAFALGIGRTVAPTPPRRPDYRYPVGDRVSLAAWPTRFRFGYVLVVAGPYWYTGVGVVGSDWDDGQWLGGGSWKRHGPVAVCRWRRRGSWRGDRQFRRVMAEAAGE